MENLTLFDGKVCRTCRLWKSFDQYNRHCATRDRLRHECKHCRGTKLIQYRADNPEKSREWSKRHNQNRLLKDPHYNSKQGKKWRAANPSRSIELALRWQAEHPDKKREYGRWYWYRHPEQGQKAHRLRKARLRGAEGRHSVLEWLDLLETTGSRCLRCGKSEDLTADHVIPIVKGGSNWITNIQPLCARCNSWKHDKHGPQFDFRSFDAEGRLVRA